MNIFKEMALSIYSYESYSKFLKNKKGKIFGFGVLLVTLYFFITWVIPAMIHPVSFSALADSLDEAMPYFTLQDGKLWVDGIYEDDDGDNYIYINTTDGYTIDDISDLGRSFQGYTSVIVADSEKMIQKNNGRWETTYFSELSEIGFNIDKYDVISFLPWLNVIIVAFYVIVYFFSVAMFFFGVLFVALFGMIIASCMKYRLSFGQLYIMGIYSRTCPLILKAIVSFLPFNIPFFWVINFAISLFIIGMAIMQMKDQSPMNPPYMQYPPNGQYPPGGQYPPNGQYMQNPQNPQGNYPPPGYPM